MFSWLFSDAAAGIIAIGVIFIPLLGSFVVFLVGKRSEKFRDILVVAIPGLTFLLALLLFWIIMEYAGHWSQPKPLILWEAQIGFMEPVFLLKADMLGATIALIASLIWFLAAIFSPLYMAHEHRRNRYYLFFLLSLGSCLGVFLTGDFLTLFFFFEVMTFASYVLVVHSESDEAMSAGNTYLFMGVGGGLLLLSGMFLLYHFTGTLIIAPAMENMVELGSARYLIAGLLITGFGVKAGMAPLHIWLPKAHPVAPAPASALLSGLMIKTGAYGIIRVLNMLFSPAQGDEKKLWHTPGDLGYIVIWIGITTMLIAAFMALFQTNAKRILAYSSVSQMGYILMGLGTAAFLGYKEGAIGLSGATYHIANHAFFKAAMFMIVGAVYLRTHQLDITRIGGLWRSFPVMTASFLIAAGGIAGVPLLNGYTSKTVLHHAIVYAAHHNASLYLAEKIFTVTSILTVCYIAKLTRGIFFGPQTEGTATFKKETPAEKIVFGMFGAMILFLGIYPSLLMEKVFLPAAAVFSFYPGKIQYLLKLNFWAQSDLFAIGKVLALGLILFLVAGHLLNRIKLPGFISIEYLLFRPSLKLAVAVYTGISRAIDTLVDKSYIYSPYPLRIFTISAMIADRAAENMIINSMPSLKKASLNLAKFDVVTPVMLGMVASQAAVQARDFVYNLWRTLVRSILYRVWLCLKKGFYLLVRLDYRPRQNLFFQTINISNLDFALISTIMFLLILFSLWFILQ